MRKLKNLLMVIVLGAMSIVTLMNPITASAAQEYSVIRFSNGGYHHSLKITDSDLNLSDGIGYCFNATISWPGNTRKTNYSKYSDASQDQFLSLASTPRDGGKDLKKHILEVCYKGYPNDGIGLKQKYGLSIEQFNFVTQLAIWYYTDSLNPKDTAIYKNSYSWMYDDNAEKAFNDIINKPVKLPDNYALDLYYKDGADIQNVLSTRLSKDYVNPNPNPQPEPEPEKTKKVIVKKTWEMYGHDENEKPDKVQVELYKDGKLHETVDLTKANNWTHTWDALPESSTYTAKELTVNDKWVNRVEEYDNATNTINIYNSMKPELSITKSVIGEYGDKAKKFTFQLNLIDENGNGLTGDYTYVKGTTTGTLTFNNGQSTLELADSETITIKNLPPKVKYSILETGLEGKYKAKYYIGDIEQTNDKAEATILNTSLNNKVKVVNECQDDYVPDTGINDGSNYTGALLGFLMGCILLFGGLTVIQHRKRVR